MDQLIGGDGAWPSLVWYQPCPAITALAVNQPTEHDGRAAG
jgi:hypothetical protein